MSTEPPAGAGTPAANRRRWWTLALGLYALAAIADGSRHLDADIRHHDGGIHAANLAVAFAGGLFWPVDLIAAGLLAVG